MDGIFKKILIILLEEAYKETNKNDDLLTILDRFNFYLKNKDDDGFRFLPESQMVQYDDYWIRTLFTNILQVLNKQKLKGSYLRLAILLDTFLYRNVNNVFSIWKRESDYQYTYEKIGISPQLIINLNPFVFTDDLKQRNCLLDNLHSIEKKLEKDDISLIYEISPPKIMKEDERTGLAFHNGDGRSIPAAVISPYIKSLKDVANTTPNIHISLVGKNIKDKKEVIEKCCDIINNSLTNYLKGKWVELRLKALQN